MSNARDSLNAFPFGACSVPQSRYERVLLGHGSGGQLTADLIQRLFVPGFANEVLGALEDQATLDWPPPLFPSSSPFSPSSPPRSEEGGVSVSPSPLRGGGRGAGSRLAFTTDAFVVRPLFFPGGDIGRLAVHGTVNDLAVGGARPLFLSAAFILEEGLALT